MIIFRFIHIFANSIISFLCLSNIPLYMCVCVCVHMHTYVCVHIYIPGVLNPPAEDWYWSMAYWEIGHTAEGEWLGKWVKLHLLFIIAGITTWTFPTPSVEKLFSKKPVPAVKKVRNHWYKLYLPYVWWGLGFLPWFGDYKYYYLHIGVHEFFSPMWIYHFFSWKAIRERNSLYFPKCIFIFAFIIVTGNVF